MEGSSLRFSRMRRTRIEGRDFGELVVIFPILYPFYFKLHSGFAKYSSAEIDSQLFARSGPPVPH